MTKLKDLKNRFMEDPEFREEYVRVDEEYALIEALGYQQLQRVEQTWRPLKSGLRLRPVYHRAMHRIHAHIAITVLALLLERIAEHACEDTWRSIRDDLKQIQLAQLLGPNGAVWQVTQPRRGARKRLKSLQIKTPRFVRKLA